MFINYTFADQARSSASPKRSAEQVATFRRELAKRFDDSEVVRERWQTIFQIVKRRSKASLDEAMPESNLAVRVWAGAQPNAEMVSTSPSLPVPSSFMVAHFREEFGTVKTLERAVADDTPYVVESSGVPPRCATARGVVGTPFGCRCEPRNVCKESLPIAAVAPFTMLCQALGRFVDTIKKTAATGQFLFCFIGKHDGVAQKFAFALLGGASFNPKVQTYVRCSPIGDITCETTG